MKTYEILLKLKLGGKDIERVCAFVIYANSKNQAKEICFDTCIENKTLNELYDDDKLKNELSLYNKKIDNDFCKKWICFDVSIM